MQKNGGMKIVCSFLLTALLLTSLQAEENSQDCCNSLELLPELRVSYFYPTHHRFRKIYGEGGLYSAEFSMQAWRELYPFASVGYFHKSGRSIGFHNRTDITIVPISLGLKYIYPMDCISPYLGLGVLGGYVHTHDHGSTVRSKISRWGIGGIAKGGFLAYVTCDLFLDFFVDYGYLPVDYHHHQAGVFSHDANISFISTGAGLGYRF